jgi:hypothetical protein
MLGSVYPNPPRCPEVRFREANSSKLRCVLTPYNPFLGKLRVTDDPEGCMLN